MACWNCVGNPYRNNWYFLAMIKKRITVEKLDNKGIVIERTITEEY
jgi:hypothetical protein